MLPRTESDGPHRNSAVKVALLTKTSDDTESYTPVAKPRRKKRASDIQVTSLTENIVSKETNVVNSHSPVTPTKSNNSKVIIILCLNHILCKNLDTGFYE